MLECPSRAKVTYYGALLQSEIVFITGHEDHELWYEQSDRPKKDRVCGFRPEFEGSDLLPETEPMRSALRDTKMHSREGAYDHGTDAGVYDTYSAAPRAIMLKADRGRRGFRFDRAYLAHAHGDNENNRQNDDI